MLTGVPDGVGPFFQNYMSLPRLCKRSQGSQSRWSTKAVYSLTELHVAQAIAILILAGGFSIAVTATSPAGPRERRLVSQSRCSTTELDLR